MKKYNKTDYAINKTNEDAIVYRFADGTIKHITVDDFGGDIEAFRKWKSISDKDYLVCDRHTYNTTRLDVSIEGIDETTLCSLPSVEDMLVEQENNEEFSLEMKEFLEKLTDVQKQRLYLFTFKHFSATQIAQIEGVHFTTVYKSLTKIEKMFKKYVETVLKNGKKITLGERLRCYESYFEKAAEDLKNRKNKK